MMERPSNMVHVFSNVPAATIPRSVFDRSRNYKTTIDTDYIYPFFMDEVLPGDTYNVDATIFCRMQTTVVPFMDNLYMDTFYFFVPLRLLWTNFQRFMGERDPDPDSSTDFDLPIVDANAGVDPEELFDYLGIPPSVECYPVAFHSRAYNLIWNSWFRDENLQDSVVVDTGDGDDDPGDYVLLKRGKRHDYFTSCLPWPQKLDDGVTLPLGSVAPVVGFGKENQTYQAGPAAVYETGGSGTVNYANYQSVDASTGANLTFKVEEDPSNSGYPAIYADLSDATAATINSIREAFQLQKLYERDARGGTRYTEIVRSHFGVVSPDARLQRPEFLGGSTSPVVLTPVSQNAYSATRPLGSLAAMGTVVERGSGFVKSFTEHGVLLGLVNIRADLNYQSGLQRMYSRSTRFDMYWPALSNLGEQEVLNKEIYLDCVNPDDAFGYQERWAEYRYGISLVTSKFRSEHASSLDGWHLAQDFGALPTLGATFIEENVPMERVLVVTDECDFFFDSYIKVRCTRPMPVYSVPGLIDHF